MAARPRGAIKALQPEDKPLLKVADKAFLKGPNIHADQSVLVARAHGGDELGLLSLPVPAGLGVLEGCREIPGGSEPADLIAASREGLPDDADGWALTFAIAERALAPHSLVSGRGRLLSEGDGEAIVIVPADLPGPGQAALRLGITLALAMHGARGRKGGEWMIGRYRELSGAIAAQALDMSTLAVARRAMELDIPAYRLSPAQLVTQLGQGIHIRLVTETVLDPQSHHANRLARDKWSTVLRLKAFGLPSLRSQMVTDAESAVRAARELGRPVVVKPVAGAKGLGISLALTTEDQVRNAYRIAARYGPQVLVETYKQGDDHRLTVVDGKMIAGARRVAATVTGDGTRTVRQLIAALNADPRRGEGFEKLMVKVPVDARLETLLGQQGLHLDAVPAAGQVVKCSLAANVSQGGTAIDVTDIIHPDNRLAAELAARSVHALVAGVDFFTPDISKSWRDGEGWILEVNTSPGLRPHWIANPQQDVVTPIVRVAFPEGSVGRVPTAGITGSIGKSTTCQMLAQIARTAGCHPGLSTTQGTWSGDIHLRRNDCAGGSAARDMLSDPLVDISITEFARGGLLKNGMVLDTIDVAAVLNLADNHVGLDGIETRADLARVKAIPVRHARAWAFLNADEPLVLAMRQDMAPGAKLGLVSPDPKSPALVAHRKADGCTVTIEGKGKAARIAIRQGEALEFEFKLAAIPAAGGVPMAAIAENAMFAAAVALRLGLSAADVAAGLGSFTSDPQQNPGRHNHIEGLPFELMLTWADGVTPLRELIALRDATPAKGKRHLNFIVPGNRSDEWIREMGLAAAGHFDRYWCSDMQDLRGREPGAVPALLAEGLREGGVADEAITLLPGEERALGPMLAQVEPGAQVTVIALATNASLRDIEKFRSEFGGAKLAPSPPVRAARRRSAPAGSA